MGTGLPISNSGSNCHYKKLIIRYSIKDHLKVLYRADLGGKGEPKNTNTHRRGIFLLGTKLVVENLREAGRIERDIPYESVLKKQKARIQMHR